MKDKKRIAGVSAPVLSLLGLALAFPASAQQSSAQSQVQVLTNPDLNEPVQFDVSAPLRELAASPRVGSHRPHAVLQRGFRLFANSVIEARLAPALLA